MSFSIASRRLFSPCRDDDSITSLRMLLQGFGNPRCSNALSSLGHLQGKELWIEVGQEFFSSQTKEKDNPAADLPSALLWSDSSLLNVFQSE